MVSVVVPCYNCEKTLSRCISSIKKQTRAELEIVLVDDGSSDGTGEMCDNAAAEDVRIKVIHQENKGLMNAWKRGVTEASGEFVAFCDADDYIDDNMIEVLEDKAIQYQADIVLGGMWQEYSDGTIICVDNRLPGGYYEKKDIASTILPFYYSCESMESNIILASRCVKLFRKTLLVKNFVYLNDNISLGEDDLTVFSTVLSADSIYCIDKFFSYHYVKNSDSMIGKYDKNMFHKFLDLREQMYFVARAQNYGYLEQIDKAFVSNVLLCMKKEICRNRESGYRQIRHNLICMRDNPIFADAISKVEIKKYGIMSRVFAKLVIKRRYLVLYIMTNIMSGLGIGKP